MQSMLSFVNNKRKEEEKLPAYFIENGYIYFKQLQHHHQQQITSVLQYSWMNVGVYVWSGKKWRAKLRIQRAVNTIGWIDQVNKFKGSASVRNNKFK